MKYIHCHISSQSTEIEMQKKSYTLVMMILCVLFWGSVFPVAKLLLVNMSGLSLAVCRFIIAVFCLGLYMKLRHITLPSLKLWQWSIIIATGAIGIGAFNYIFFSGLLHTSSTNAALIMALSPIMTALLYSLVTRSYLAKKQIVSLIIALSGVTLVLTKGNMAHLVEFHFNQGDLLMICAMIIWSSYTLCSQKLSNWLPAVAYTQVSMASGGLSLLIFSLMQANQHTWQEVQTLPPTALMGVLYIGVFSTVLAYLFWIKGVAELGSTKASPFFNLVPVFAALISLLFGQTVTQVQFLGMLVVLIGLSLPIWSSLFNKSALINLKIAK